MELRSLLHFLAVIDAGAFSVAARHLNISQPALTKRIRALEDELGVKLFERLPRGVAPTAFGEVLAQHVRLIRTEVSNATAEIEALSGGRQGTVRVGAGPGWVATFLPRAITQLHARLPEIRVVVVQAQDDALRSALSKGELDFLVAAIPLGEPEENVECQPLLSDDLCVVARVDHPLAQRRRLGLKNLLDYPWVLSSQGTALRQRLEHLFRVAGLQPPVPVVETDSLAMRLSLPRCGDYLTFTATQNLAEFGRQTLVPLKVPEATWKRDAGVTMRATGFVSPAARALIFELKQVCVELAS